MKLMITKMISKRLIFSLLLLGLLNIILLSRVYWNNSVPVGWDTPVYIYLTKLTMRDGVYGLVQQTYYSHFYTIFSSSIVSWGLLDPFSLEMVLPILLSMVSVLASGFAMWKWFRNRNLTLFAAFFSFGWFSLYAMIASIHRNLMAFVFLLVVLAYLPTYFEHRNFRLTTLFWLLGILMVLTHWETYIVSAGLLISYAVASKVVDRKTSVGNLSLNFLLYMVPFAVGVIALSPVLALFVAHYIKILLQVSSSVSIFELPLYLGGHLLPFVVLGLASGIKELRTNSNTLRPALVLLISWTAVVSAAAFIIPSLGFYPQWRILAFFPVPFLAALGLDFTIKRLRRRKNIRAPLEHHKPTLFVLALSIIIINSWAAIQYTDAWMRPYISDNTYQDLRWIEQNYRFDQRPVVVIYFKAGDYTDGTLALYRNWINATIGEHYAYYGKLQYLLQGYSMPFQNQEYNRVSIKTWYELNKINLSISAHPILIISGDFYPNPSAYERSLLYEVGQDVFLLNSTYLSISDFYNVRLIAFRDSYSSSNNWYAAKKYWASERVVAEHSENSPKTEFNMTFSLPIYRAGNYIINIQMFDYATTSAPVEITLDRSTMSTLRYSGTMREKVFQVGPILLQPKLYFLTLRINDPSMAHQISLDYVECLLEK